MLFRVDGGSDRTQADFSADPPESAKRTVLAESAADIVNSPPVLFTVEDSKRF